MSRVNTEQRSGTLHKKAALSALAFITELFLCCLGLTDLIAGNEASGNFFSTFSSKYLHLLVYWRPGSGEPYKVTPLMISSKCTVNSV